MSEAKMARASLKKTIAYSTELLSMIGKDAEIEGWIQAKISEMDHHVEAIYGYYKFGDDEEAEAAGEDDEEEEDEDESSGRVIISMDDFPRP